MKNLLLGLSIGVLLVSGAAFGIVYKNELPWCAVNPLDGCKMTKLQDIEAERKRLADKLAEAGFNGNSLDEQLDAILQGQRNVLSDAQDIVQSMQEGLTTQPVTNVNVALALANEKLNDYSGRIHELEAILCAAPSMANVASCQL